MFLFDETEILGNVLGCFRRHPVSIHKSLDAVKLMVVVVVGQLGVMEEGRDVGNNRGWAFCEQWVGMCPIEG